MKIATLIVTCNRLELLPRALLSVKNQSRKPNFICIISNSTNENYVTEQKICSEFGFKIIKNYRTKNNSGALNTGIEEVVRVIGISEDVYVAFLDDDDEWFSDYLEIIENKNECSYDILIAELTRDNGNFKNLQTLPDNLSIYTFLKGNPGIGNSNTFVRLTTLLKAGCYDEACLSNVDRDLLIRIFQLNPKYLIIHKLLVITYTDNARPRITNNTLIRQKSFQYFYYKYSGFMSDEIKKEYFEWAGKLFNLSQSQIVSIEATQIQHFQNDICFDNKGISYQFVIGFIAGNDKIAARVVEQIIRKIPADLIIIIDDAPKSENLDNTYLILKENHIPFKIVRYSEWKVNLSNGYYGVYFEKFDDINSIPLGRTILHRHLFDETSEFKNPVYWIIDDDTDFNAISTSENGFHFFDLIGENLNKTDAIIGGISNDPPIPTLSCIRSQLVDYFYSYNTKNTTMDFNGIHKKTEYYYDLSDLHTDHLETPIYRTPVNTEHLHHIFAGKAVFRPALQQKIKSESKTITRRGANTIVLNRDVFRLYPVINLEVDEKFARRGDLTWALFNQIVSDKKIIEHTFCINHNRPLTDFKLEKELDKSAYDIIGYAFNKAILKTIVRIKSEKEIEGTEEIFSKLLENLYFDELKSTYLFYLNKRKSRFLMNYHRIIGLTKIISEKFDSGNEYYEQFKDESKISSFEKLLQNAVSEPHLIKFLEELRHIVKEN